MRGGLTPSGQRAIQQGGGWEGMHRGTGAAAAHTSTATGCRLACPRRTVCTGLHRSDALSCGLKASTPGGCRMEMQTLPSGKTLGCLQVRQAVAGQAVAGRAGGGRWVGRQRRSHKVARRGRGWVLAQGRSLIAQQLLPASAHAAKTQSTPPQPSPIRGN